MQVSKMLFWSFSVEGIKTVKPGHDKNEYDTVNLSVITRTTGMGAVRLFSRGKLRISVYPALQIG